MRAARVWPACSLARSIMGRRTYSAACASSIHRPWQGWFLWQEWRTSPAQTSRLYRSSRFPLHHFLGFQRRKFCCRPWYCRGLLPGARRRIYENWSRGRLAEQLGELVCAAKLLRLSQENPPRECTRIKAAQVGRFIFAVSMLQGLRIKLATRAVRAFITDPDDA